jgi:hypothetical protein
MVVPNAFYFNVRMGHFPTTQIKLVLKSIPKIRFIDSNNQTN